MKPDIPLIGQTERKANRLLTTQLFEHEAAGLMRSRLKFADLQRLHELRKSCGVISESTSNVQIRLPYQYQK
jgi:hypothetical protein